MNEIKIGKHWLCYLPVGFIAIICILLLTFGTGKVLWLGWILVGFDVLGYLTIRNYKWTAKNGEILIESGVLPWQKGYIRVPVHGVMGATVERGFLGWFFDYGTITIHALGGASSRIKATNMKGAIHFMEQVTGKDYGYKSSSLEA